MLVASGRRWALMTENETEAEPRLQDMILQLDRERVDLILVEGFKAEVFPKIELYRPALKHSPMYVADPSIIAIAADGELPVTTPLPVLDINDPAAIAEFICDRFLRR